MQYNHALFLSGFSNDWDVLDIDRLCSTYGKVHSLYTSISKKWGNPYAVICFHPARSGEKDPVEHAIRNLH